MKILFYDVKKFELDYLQEKIYSNLEPYFFKNSLNSFLELQEDIYEVMLEHGWYQVEQVTEDKLSQARNKYCN